MLSNILLIASTVITIAGSIDEPLKSIVSTMEKTASGLEKVAVFLNKDFKQGENKMLQYYMCSDCGIEYDDNTDNPKGCPSCESQDNVRVLAPATDGSMHGSLCLESD